MISVRSGDLWSELQELFKKTKHIKAAVAYVSDNSCISFGKGDVLVVDASDASIAGGRTSAIVLKAAHDKGTKLYSCDTLHGKVIVFNHHAYIGSANISENSKKRLDEIGVISDHPNIMAGAIELIGKLASKSIEIDSEFIKRISKINVKRSAPPPSTGPIKVVIEKPCAWLISIRNDADYPGDIKKVKEDNELIETTEDEEPSWLWMNKGSRFFDEAKTGDSIVIIERKTKESEKPESAYRHSTIKSITSDKNNKTKAYHFAYTEDYVIKWSSFKKLAEKAGISRLGSGLNTLRMLSEKESNALFVMWGA